MNALCNRKPVKLLENGCNMTGRGSSCDDPWCRILYKLEFAKSFLGKTKQEGVAVVKPRSDKTVNQYGSSVRCKGGT